MKTHVTDLPIALLLCTLCKKELSFYKIRYFWVFLKFMRRIIFRALQPIMTHTLHEAKIKIKLLKNGSSYKIYKNYRSH